MKYIYKYENKINGKVYIGQTNNIQKRKNGHKSCSFNPKSNDYNIPFHSAIRKYGLNSFNFTILEEIDDSKNQNYVNDREKYYIEQYQSLISLNGYNVSQGGQRFSLEKRTYEEKLQLSKLFTKDEIIDIQNLLIANKNFNEILEKYSPRLKYSYLMNINTGLNFKNPLFDYPLKKEINRSHFSKEEIKQIKDRIKSGEIYKTIAKDFNIKSIGFISGINSGKYFFDKNETYPLYIKGCNKKANEIWVKKIIDDLLNTSLTQDEIAKKYNKSRSTVTNINAGHSHKKDGLNYPLRKK